MPERKKRAGNKELGEKRKEKRNAQEKLRECRKAQGLNPRIRESPPNHRCSYETAEDEKSEREEAVTEQLRIIKAYLPVLPNRLAGIGDPRNPKKCRHKLTVLMIYGILTFVFQMSSGREANREMTRPVFIKNLLLYFPELADMPHNDTLMRLLSEIGVEEIGKAHIELIRRFIRKKKFRRYLIDNCYPVAADGTRKFVRSGIWDEECPERGKGDRKQYYVYVPEASPVFHNGMTVPFMTEILSYTEGYTENEKQDCELKAFYRLARRLKQEFPRLPIMVLPDSLCAKGPVIELCRENRWQFMIVLKDSTLSSVWEEFNVIKELEQDNRAKMKRGNRRQCFQWVSGIEYCYGDREKSRLIFHIVVCEEEWEEVNSDAEVGTKTAAAPGYQANLSTDGIFMNAATREPAAGGALKQVSWLKKGTDGSMSTVFHTTGTP